MTPTQEQIKQFKLIFGQNDPILDWIQEELDKGKSPKETEIDYKAFHILGNMGSN